MPIERNDESESALRIYNVSSDEGRTERQYLTDDKNRLRDYAFNGYLISQEGRHEERAFPVGSIVMASDILERTRFRVFPLLARVLNVCEVDKNDLELFYRPDDVRLYYLGNSEGRKVVATNKENIIYNGSTPQALFDLDLGRFREGLLFPDANVSIMPIFSGIYRPNSFSVRDNMNISLPSYKIALNLFKKESEDYNDVAAAISRKHGSNIFDAEQAMGRARRQGRTLHAQELGEIIKDLKRKEQEELHAAGMPPCLDEILYRFFQGGAA